jgi:hypothetical protein
MIGIPGGRPEFPAGLLEQLLGTVRVTAQLVLVRLLRSFDFFIGLGDVLLRFGEIRMPGGIDIYFRPLSEGYADEYQANEKRSAKVHAFFHGSVSLYLMENKTQSRSGWEKPNSGS